MKPRSVYGVKVEDLKKIQKKIKKNNQLALALYDTGISDARYLAGLIADENQITKADLQHWVNHANWYMISEYTVPWVAAESSHGYELALEWIDANDEMKQVAGWSTLSNIMSIKPDNELPMIKLRQLLQRVKNEIATAPNRTRYAMNGFVITAGCFVKELTEEALETGKLIGKVKVEMGNTSCKVPNAPDYIQKAIEKGTIGKKKKMARC
jgi:hypothetical protein